MEKGRIAAFLSAVVAAAIAGSIAACSTSSQPIIGDISVSRSDQNSVEAVKIAGPPAVRTLRFSGYEWKVKTSRGRVGPGSNYFSDSGDNVWVDAQERLHLRIMYRDDRWYCAEVISQRSFGYGTYRFYLDMPVEDLDPNIVLGLFTWSDDPAYSHREVDIECAKWGIRTTGPMHSSSCNHTVSPGISCAFKSPLGRIPLPIALRGSRRAFSFRA